MVRALNRKLFALLAGALLPLALPGAAPASKPKAEAPQTFDLRSFACPLGGEKFSQDVGYSAFPLLTLPDGSWLGDFQIGTQIPICPGNGLVLIPKFDPYQAENDPGAKFEYPDYTATELAQLPALIASGEYRQLKADGAYLQAYWLATKLGRPAYGRFNLLQRATWATSNPAQRRRLVERFAADAPALIDAADVPAGAKQFLQGYVVNALRELGRFDEAKTLYARLYQSAAAVPGLDAAQNDMQQSPMARAIAERDDGWFAAETLDRRMFGDICSGDLARLYGPTKPATKVACKVRREREAQAERDDQAAFEESAKLKQDAAALRTKCAATPEAQRSKGLMLACDALSFKEDSLAGDKLAQDGPALAAACEATPADKRSGPLSSGCIGYEISLTSALGELLPDDPEAYAILCKGQQGDHWADEAYWVVSACDDTARALVDRGADKLMQDLPTLDRACAAKGEDDYSNPSLGSACIQRKLDLENGQVNRLANDPAAFAALCGKLDLKAEFDYDADQFRTVVTCRDAKRRRDINVDEAKEKAKGLDCYGEPGDRMCSSPADMAADEARREASKGIDTLDPKAGGPSMFDDGSSLMQAARAHAAQVIAEAKRTRTYPKLQPGDAP